MTRRTLATITALLLTLAGAVTAATPAAANATFGCSRSDIPGLSMTATRINYGGNQSAIYASATKSKVEVVTAGPDVTWTFYSFGSTSGLQSRYATPTQWGNTANPLDLSTEYITVTWKGKNNTGGTYPNKTCTTRVGV